MRARPETGKSKFQVAMAACGLCKSLFFNSGGRREGRREWRLLESEQREIVSRWKEVGSQRGEGRGAGEMKR
jgi:hypothetical protein